MSTTVIERTGPADERPLNEEERKMVARLLSDPFSFPQTFKTWIIAFLEGSDLTLPLGSVSGLVGLLGSGSGTAGSGIFGLLPAGILFPWSGQAVPSGTFLCLGQAISRVDFKRLFDSIGTQWGPGNGSTTFNLPDVQNRMLMGTGPGFAIGANEGRAAVNRGPSHHHHFTDTKGFSASGSTSDAGSHAHTYRRHTESSAAAVSGGSSVGLPGAFDASTDAQGQHAHSVNVNGSVGIDGDTTGGGDQDRPSFLALPVLINY